MAAQIVQVLVEIGHKASYRRKPTPDRTHDWILFVRGSEGHDISHFVEKIVFNLHQSFNPPRRVFKSPPYELRESGYGEFMPMIDIYFKNKGEKGAPRKVTIQYYLNLNREDSPPIDNVRPEKLKFHNPAEEFLEKVLKSGGVILGPDGCPLPSSKPRPPLVADLQPSASQMFDSRNHDSSDFLVDVDSAAKSASQLAKKRKRSTEANPMSNDSNSSNESLHSRRSSKSDPTLDKDSDACGTKRKMHGSHGAPFESTDDESSKKKKKQQLEKLDLSKSRSTEQKMMKVEDSKHQSSKDEGRKHSSSKSHHSRHEHREKSAHGGHAHSKPKSTVRNSRSSSRTPSKAKSSESLSGSRVHSSSSHGGSGGSSTHHRSSSSSSHHHGNSKSSKVEGSRHGGSQSQKSEHHGSSSSSKHRTSSSDIKSDRSLSRKMDVQVRLSPMDIQISDSTNPRSGRKLETTSGNRIRPSPDGFSSQKPIHSSPVKKRPKNAVLTSPLVGYLPPTFDLNGKTYDDPFSSANRIRPKYDKLLDDMKSDDEEEDGEIRSPVATEPPELVPWKVTSSGGGDRKEKSKESSLDRKKSSSTRTLSSSATPRLEKPERFPFGVEKPSPTKAKSDWSSSEKNSPEDFSSGSSSQVKAKKSTENVDGDSRLSKKPSNSKSGSHRTSEKGVKQTAKGLPSTELSSFTVKSESDEKDVHDFFKVEQQWESSYSSIKTDDVSLKKEIESYAVKTESTFYDEKKSSDLAKCESSPKEATYSDRAPNGELLMSLVEMKEKINRMTSAALLNRIVDVIEAAGKLKSDDEALEFDFCQLDSDTMHRVKQLLETVSD